MTPPPLSDPSIPLSSCVTLCPWTDGMLRELGSYTIQHSVTLQWPVVCRPPWENGISTKPQPCDPASAELSESRSLCTALTRMSPHLFFLPVPEKSCCGEQVVFFHTKFSLDSCSGRFLAALCYCVFDLLTHVFGSIPRWLIVGVAIPISSYFILLKFQMFRPPQECT